MTRNYSKAGNLRGFVACALFGAAFIVSIRAGAQEFSLTETERSYREASTILEAGMAAFGGQAKLESIRNISFRYNGHHNAFLQNVKPDFTQNPLKRTGQVILDLQEGRILYEDKADRAGQYTGWHRYLITGDLAVNINLRHQPFGFRNIAPAPIRERLQFMLPQLILREAAKQRSSLRRLENADINGKSHHLISYCPKENEQITLFFDSDSHILTKVEVLDSLPVYGDRTRQYLFLDYAKEGDFALPHKRLSMLSGALLEDVAYSDFSVNSNLAENIFKLPDGAMENDDLQERAKRPVATTEFSRDVYTLDHLRGSDNRILFVVFRDFVLVSGAPFGYSEEAIKRIREKVPDKPIRYIIPTHHDYSHGGGLRPYIAEGVTIVTTPGNVAFVREMATSPHTLQPDQLTIAPRPPSIEIIRDKHRIFQDQDHRVDVYDIGPTSHAEEMLILYLPSEEILYQGDLLELDDEDPITSLTANQVTVEFYEKLKEMKLRVKTIIGTEGRTATLEDLQKAVQLRIESQ